MVLGLSAATAVPGESNSAGGGGAAVIVHKIDISV